MMVVLMVITTGVFVVLAAGKVRSEESDGRAEPVLATSVSRPAWLAGHVLVTAVAAVVLLVLSGAGVGLAAAVGTRAWSVLHARGVASRVYSTARPVILGVSGAG